MRPTFTDANVLYPSLLRNLLMRLSLAGACDLRWSDRVHEEWISNLVQKSGVNEASLRRTRAQMDTALPSARVIGFEALIGILTLPDPDDRHVLAAALHSGARELLTFNLKDFPAPALSRYGMVAVHPDSWLCRLCDHYPEVVQRAVQDLLAALKKPPLSAEQLTAALHRLNVPDAARQITELLNDDRPAEEHP